MTFDIGLHEVCVRTGVRYVITKFSGWIVYQIFLPMVLRCARASRARELRYNNYLGLPLEMQLLKGIR